VIDHKEIADPQTITDVMDRAFKEKPIQTTVKGIVYLTALALWSWGANRDEEWYQKLDARYKYSNNVY